MEVLRPRRAFSMFVAVLIAVAGFAWIGASAQDLLPYQVIASQGVQTLPIVRRTGTTDFVALDALPRFFDLTMREDPRGDGIVLAAGAQRVVLRTGQATVSAAGRLVSLSAPVAKDGATWLVPIDFLRVLEPLLNRRIDIRRASRLIVLDTASVPRLTARVERAAGGGRLLISVDPAVPSRVSRAGNLVTVRFQADALDLTPIADAPAELLASMRSLGPSLVVELGSLVINVRQQESADLARITLDLIAAPAPVPGRPDAPVPPPPLPTIERAGGIRTVVIDPGHGGSDVGTRNPAGLEEKHITLAAAQRLRATLEAQLGVRAILTRESDTDVAIDPRAAIANNNKADIFISLHVNASHADAVRGWQVQSLDPTDYGTPAPEAETASQSVPLAGGGSRVISIVPWQLAQIPHARQSATLAELLAARLAEAGLRGHGVPVLQTPARVLVGANMPAVLIEMGFLTNGDDAALLDSKEFHGKLAEIITSVINGLRSGWPTPPGGGRP